MKKPFVHMEEKILLYMLLTVLFLVNTSAIHVGVAEVTPKLYVDPSSIIDPTLNSSKTFSINITIANVTDLRNYDIKLGYDTTILNVLSVGVSPIENLPRANWTINDQVGVIWINVTYNGSAVTTEIPVTLATIEFQVQDFGESILDLYDTELADSQGGSISHEAFDGYFDNRMPPTASFTYSPPIPSVNETVTFDASASYAPGGYIVNYTWDFGDYSSIIITNETIVTHAYTVGGTYTVTLTVTDNHRLTNATTESITIGSPPVAIFTYSPGAPTVGQLVTFDATASYDHDGYIVSYAWNFGDGNTTTTSAQIITHVYTLAGNYTVILMVTDNASLTGTSIKVVMVGGIPVARFTYSPKVPLVDQPVTFDASASYDIDGYIVSYTWDFDDGNITTTSDPIITHIYAAAGTYTVTLMVTDNASLTDTYFEDVRVTFPRTIFYVDPKRSAVAVNEIFSINVSISNVINLYGYEFKLCYDTTFLDGLNVTLPQGHLLTPTDPNNIFIAKLEINDAYNATHGRVYVAVTLLAPEPSKNGSGTLATITFKVTGLGSCFLDLYDTKPSDTRANMIKHDVEDGYFSNQFPIALFTYSPFIPLVDEIVTFNASASWDVDGYIVDYTWDFGDGNVTTTSEPVITHVYATARTYNVTLTVTDNDTRTDTSAKTVKVVEAGRPEAIFTYSPGAPTVGQLVTFNATASYDVSPGYIVSYAWAFGDGTTGTGMIANHTYTSAGTYTVTLTVTDNEGLIDTATADITVSVHDVAIIDVTASPTEVPVGKPVYINVTVANEGTEPETFNVTVYANTTSVASQTVTLESGAFTTVTFTWNTTGFAKGNYTISAVADTVSGETDTADNTYVDGEATVMALLAPVADFTYSPLTPYTDETVTFNATASYDPDGSIVSYSWDFGDGSTPVTETDPIITHIYTEPRTYNVTLTVTDNDGLNHNTTKSITVQETPSAPSYTLYLVAVIAIVVLAATAAYYYMKIKKH